MGGVYTDVLVSDQNLKLKLESRENQHLHMYVRNSECTIIGGTNRTIEE